MLQRSGKSGLHNSQTSPALKERADEVSAKSLSVVERRPTRSGSFKLRRESSVRSLASLVSLRARKKEEQDTISYTGSQKTYSEELKDKFQELGGFGRRLSRRMSSIITPRKAVVDGRRGSDSTLVFDKKPSFSISGTAELEIRRRPTKPVRKVQRKDLPICWQDETQVKQTRRVEVTGSLDLLTRLHQRVYTRHLSRYILSFLGQAEFEAMYQVSESWERILDKSLPHPLISRIIKEVALTKS